MQNDSMSCTVLSTATRAKQLCWPWNREEQKSYGEKGKKTCKNNRTRPIPAKVQVISRNIATINRYQRYRGKEV